MALDSIYKQNSVMNSPRDHISTRSHAGGKKMMKNPLEMNYDELEKTLDHLLKNMDLPCSIHYHNDTINYHHYTRRRLLCSSLYRLIESTIFFQSYIKKRIYPYRKMEIFKSFRIYFSLFKIGLTDLILQMNGSGDDRLPAHYIIAAMLYDASCDIPQYKPYLKDFNDFIMFDKEIVPRDEYLRLFNESMTYIKTLLIKKHMRRLYSTSKSNISVRFSACTK